MFFRRTVSELNSNIVAMNANKQAKATTIYVIRNYTSTANEWFYTGISVTIPANSFFAISAHLVFANSAPTGVAISYNNNIDISWDIVALGLPIDDIRGYISACSYVGYTSESPQTFYIHGKYNSAAYNYGYMEGFYMPR